tara:strand:- start:278 stop:499 length:222 start_codon:yes stop_codon:yes gene_type:complete
LGRSSALGLGDTNPDRRRIAHVAFEMEGLQTTARIDEARKVSTQLRNKLIVMNIKTTLLMGILFYLVWKIAHV